MKVAPGVQVRLFPSWRDPWIGVQLEPAQPRHDVLRLHVSVVPFLPALVIVDHQALRHLTGRLLIAVERRLLPAADLAQPFPELRPAPGEQPHPGSD